MYFRIRWIISSKCLLFLLTLKEVQTTRWYIDVYFYYPPLETSIERIHWKKYIMFFHKYSVLFTLNLWILQSFLGTSTEANPFNHVQYLIILTTWQLGTCIWCTSTVAGWSCACLFDWNTAIIITVCVMKPNQGTDHKGC